MEKKRIYLSCPTIHGDEQKFVQEAFDTNWVAPLGPNVNAFEKELAEYVGIPYASALSAGTAAIHLALKIIGVQPGDIVFSTDLTFAATCNPITYEKAVPVFIDSEEDTWNMSPEALKKAFDKYPNPKAVVVAHLYGTPAKMDEIMAICAKHNVPVLDNYKEDCIIKVRDAEFRKKYFQGANDTAHLNDAGHDLFMSVGEEFLLNLFK